MDKETQEKLLELVRSNYEEIAEEFSKTRQEFWPGMKKLGDYVKDGDSVLDAGCGNGRLLEVFKDKKINYVGVDGSERLIELAKKRYKIQDTRYKFMVGDILELDKMLLGYFDNVFCIAVLHQIPGEDLQIKALEQLKNGVKENGKIIISVWRLWKQLRYLKLIVKFALLKILKKIGLMSRRASRDLDFTLRTSGDFGDIIFNWGNAERKIRSDRYYHAFRKCELKKIIKKAGLKIEKIYKDKYNYYVVLTK